MFKPVKLMETSCVDGHSQVALVGVQPGEPVLLFQVNLIFLLFITPCSRTAYSCFSSPIVSSTSVKLSAE